MKKAEFTLNSYDGSELYACEWKADSEKTGTICLVHGLGEHCGRYDHVVKAYLEKGFSVLSFDRQGHGRSGGKRGHISSYETLMQDIGTLIGEAKKRYPDVPCFLYGHSLGGNLVLNYALRKKPSIAGVISTSPWLRIPVEFTDAVMNMLRVLYKVYPAFTRSNDIDAALISHDHEYVQNYKNDSLVHGKISVRLFLDAYEAGLWAIEHANELQIPLLLMHGTSDAITSCAGSRSFSEKAAGDITLKLWDGCYHELHNEVGKNGIIEFMINWAEERKKKCIS